jgi:PAS domain S-box-containing protein
MMNILLVDDDSNLLDLVQRFLKREEEMHIDTSTSGANAMDKLMAGRYDAIVLDYELPGMNGIEFLKMVKARGDETPIIIFTGKGREEVVIKALNLGADYYLQKRGDPRLNFLELLYMIREAVRRHHARQELNESERRFRESLENAHLIAFQQDENGKVTFCNDFFLDLTGYERSMVLGTDWIETFVPRPEREAVRQMFSTVISAGRTGSYFSCTINARVDQTRRVALSNTALFDSGGKYCGISSIGEDITERERMEREMALSEGRFKTLFEHAPYAYFLTDLKGNFVDGNRAAEVLVGYAREELLGRNFLETGLLPPDQVPKAIALLARHVEGEATGPEEFIINGKDGSQVVVEIRNLPITMGDRALVLGSAHDVTRRKQVEESLRRVNAKMTLLNIITRHDILNTVTALLLYVELLKEDPRDDAQKEMLGKVELLAQTIRRQIEFTKLYQDIGIQSPQWQSISRIIGREADQAGLRGLLVKSDIAGLEVYADPLLENVFHNLIDNSLRHGGGVTSAWLTSLRDENGLKIVYEDNGKGIPSREKEEIFKRGYGKNTGFGLFLAREILAITNLSIKETGTYGKGARFEIRVPHHCFRETNEEMFSEG